MAKQKRDVVAEQAAVRAILDTGCQQALQLVQNETPDAAFLDVGGVGGELDQLAQQQHHARGILLTLAACKSADPSRNVCLYKDKFPGGFDARGIEPAVISFLRENALPHAPPEGSASHWLTRSLAQHPYSRRKPLITQPAWVGRLLPRLVANLQDATDPEFARKVVTALLVRRLEEREAARIALTRPKNLTVIRTISLLRLHFEYRYQSRDKAPRLVQLALFAIYQLLVNSFPRYSGWRLGSLESLRAANRKSGSLGDIDVLDGNRPVEAVEVKSGILLGVSHVQDAIAKVKTTDVRRYYILSTAGINPKEEETIRKACAEFFQHNGCEIIVNGVYETLRYYLRLLGSPDLFLSRYLDLVEKDEELTFEHREAWNTNATSSQ